MKRLALFASLFALASAPALAQEEEAPTDEVFEFQTEEEELIDQAQKAMEEAFAMFADLFKTEPLTAEQEARLPIAQNISAVVVPQNMFKTVMQDTMEPMMTAIMGAVIDNPRLELAKVSGVPADELQNIEDDAAQAALDIYDPQLSARTDRLVTIMTNMMSALFDEMEPAYRDATAEVFAVKFDEAELRELTALVQTPLGAKFARESFAAQYDPRMLSVMEAMGPAMGEAFPRMIEQIEQLAADYPPARSFTTLSVAERKRVSQLLGKPVSELEALAPQPEADDATNNGEPLA
ncbi:MAG: hypothetical protein V2J51_02705 [Erythrobacter sp.]|nr:hypothetical protein [Erythrobacter sp.]